MAIADIANRLTATEVPWRTCAVCHHLEAMSTEDASALRSMLADRRLRVSDIATALRDDPDSPTIARDSLARHAAGNCAAGEKLR